MQLSEIKKQLGNIDIYLLDQLLKERYLVRDRILDAGCGDGRNIHYFIKNDFSVYGIDKNMEAIDNLKENYPAISASQFVVEELDSLSFSTNFFDHIICNAVLHFALNTAHFYKMFGELVRVLKPGGTFFIRMTSSFGLEDKIKPIGEGLFEIPDGTTRFLLNQEILMDLISNYSVTMIEPLKTVNVSGIRSMSTLMFVKD